MGKSGTMQPVRSRLTYNVPGSDIEHTYEVSPLAVRFGLHFVCASCSILSLHSTVHQNGRLYGFHVTMTSHENALYGLITVGVSDKLGMERNTWKI